MNFEMKITKRHQWYKYRKVVCNCGHYPKDHYKGEGCCDKCGCTWYYPNDKYIGRVKKIEEEVINTIKKYDRLSIFWITENRHRAKVVRDMEDKGMIIRDNDSELDRYPWCVYNISY